MHPSNLHPFVKEKETRKSLILQNIHQQLKLLHTAPSFQKLTSWATHCQLKQQNKEKKIHWDIDNITIQFLIQSYQGFYAYLYLEFNEYFLQYVDKTTSYKI